MVEHSVSEFSHEKQPESRDVFQKQKSIPPDKYAQYQLIIQNIS